MINTERNITSRSRAEVQATLLQRYTVTKLRLPFGIDILLYTVLILY